MYTAKLVYSSDKSERRLKAGDIAYNTSSNECTQMSELSSGIFGNDKHLIKCYTVENRVYREDNDELVATFSF